MPHFSVQYLRQLCQMTNQQLFLSSPTLLRQLQQCLLEIVQFHLILFNSQQLLYTQTRDYDRELFSMSFSCQILHQLAILMCNQGNICFKFSFQFFSNLGMVLCVLVIMEDLLIFISSTSCPRALDVSVNTNTAFLSETLELSKAIDSAAVIIEALLCFFGFRDLSPPKTPEFSSHNSSLLVLLSDISNWT